MTRHILAIHKNEMTYLMRGNKLLSHTSPAGGIVTGKEK